MNKTNITKFRNGIFSKFYKVRIRKNFMVILVIETGGKKILCKLKKLEKIPEAE